MDSKIGYKSIIDLGREEKVYFPHNVGEYPSKILPQVMGEFISRFSEENQLIVDPFAGSGTVAVECAIRNRKSINVDINPIALNIARKKLNLLFNSLFNNVNKEQILILADARNLPIKSETADAIITDIPYADMIKYSNLKNDLSTIENYEEFLTELYKCFEEFKRILKKDKYCVIFVADYRIARSRIILPLHADVIKMMQEVGFDLFDLYVWRYYRSGSFRPFGKKPYQAMNVHSYILVFSKPSHQKQIIKNRSIRYRKSLIEKVKKIYERSSSRS
jgi:DNA modification methylase